MKLRYFALTCKTVRTDKPDRTLRARRSVLVMRDVAVLPEGAAETTAGLIGCKDFSVLATARRTPNKQESNQI
jgi:hypothetical protein